MVTTELGSVTTALLAGIVALRVEMALLIVAGVGVALLFWGVPKLIKFFKRVAS